MREWLSGGVSPCQGEGRGFESRLALLFFSKTAGFLKIPAVFLFPRPFGECRESQHLLNFTLSQNRRFITCCGGVDMKDLMAFAMFILALLTFVFTFIK